MTETTFRLRTRGERKKEKKQKRNPASHPARGVCAPFATRRARASAYSPGTEPEGSRCTSQRVVSRRATHALPSSMYRYTLQKRAHLPSALLRLTLVAFLGESLPPRRVSPDGFRKDHHP